MSAFYLDTLSRIREATKGATTLEQRSETLIALAKTISAILIAEKHKEYNSDTIDIITKRILDTNLEPTILRAIDGYDEYYTKTFETLVNGIKFESDDEVYLTICALATITARLLIAYKSKSSEEENILKVVVRILEVNTKQ